MSDTLILQHESENIYRVMWSGKVVGTILRYTSGPELFWTWSVTRISPDPPGSKQSNGAAPSKDAAVIAFRNAWDATRSGPHFEQPEPREWRPYRPPEADRYTS